VYSGTVFIFMRMDMRTLIGCNGMLEMRGKGERLVETQTQRATDRRREERGCSMEIPDQDSRNAGSCSSADTWAVVRLRRARGEVMMLHDVSFRLSSQTDELTCRSASSHLGRFTLLFEID
jgi:hypothetical protein